VLDTTGEIDTGIFVHVPPQTPKSELFVKLLIEGVFLGNDPVVDDVDGDGRSNPEDGYPTNPDLN
jgi:hypothetical protein